MAKCLDFLIVWLLVVTDFTDFPSAGGFGDSSNLIGLVNAQTCASQNEDQDCKIRRTYEYTPTGTNNRPAPYSINRPAVTRLNVSDGLLHLYALPVGQGNSLVLQCPNGDIAIVDLGSVSNGARGFWSTDEIKAFLHGHNDKIKNIVITHNDTDHYSFFKEVFPTQNDLRGLEKIYISCTFGAMPQNHDIRNWINRIGARPKVVEFNNGRRCGHMNTAICGSITLCPGNTQIEAKVLSANAGGCTNKANVDSIVIEIKYNTFKMHLNGDFEDCSANQQNGPQQEMVIFHTPAKLQSTVYMLSHHGADRCANKEVLLDAVKPKAVFASSDPFRDNLRHPRCTITDYLIKKNYLCKPRETDRNRASFCGQHPKAPIALKDKLQQTFTCGELSANNRRLITDNEYAIYSTTPDQYTLNRVHLVTNGVDWGFTNDTKPRIIRP